MAANRQAAPDTAGPGGSPSAAGSRPTVLLTGATGFAGRHLYPALCEAGYRVRCASRDPELARQQMPGRDWVRLDVDDAASFAGALSGCQAVVYLVHQMGGGMGYAEREASAARCLRQAAADAGVKRIVYLGGVAPSGQASPHLSSRLATGALLRGGSVTTVELRAAMIVGEGSAGWQIVRDLSARLPAMVLPRWLNNHSSPVAIDDIAVALLWALGDAPPHSAVFDVPGAAVLSHRELITRVAHVLGKHPAMFQVPVVTPELSSYWIALVTRIDLGLARELVQGLQSDLIPCGESVWGHLPLRAPLDLEASARNAIADEGTGQIPSEPTRLRMQALGRAWAADHAA